MKHSFLKYVLIVFLLACSSHIPKPTTKENDKKSYDSTLNFINTFTDKLKTESILLKKLGIKDSTIDFLLQDVKKYQGSEIEKNILQLKLERIHNYSVYYEDSLKALRESLKKSEHLNKLSNSKISQQKKENELLEKRLTSFKLLDVEIVCYGFTKPKLFRSVKSYITTNAKDVKRISIKFKVSAYELIYDKTYTFNIKIKGILNKPMKIKMLGEDLAIEPLVFELMDVVKPGEYPIIINIPDKLDYTSTIILQ